MQLWVKNLWRRKLRTLLTVLGISVGVAAVVIFASFGDGMARGFGQISSSSTADLIVSQEDAILMILGSVDEEVGTWIKQLRGVEAVTGVVIGMVQLPDSPYFMVIGEDPRGFSIDHYRLIAGEPLTGKRQILLGKSCAESFKKNVGDKFRINGVGYRVVGIYETGSSIEDFGAVIHIDDAQRAFDRRGRVSYFSIKLRDITERDAVIQAIESQWDELLVTRSGEPTKQDEMLDMYRSLGWVLGLFAVLVGGLGMTNTMLMSVFERTREIGVLRAIGWRRRRVLTLILGESALLAIIGGALGLLLGIGGVALASLSPAVGGFLSNTVGPAILVQAGLTALVLGLLGGAYPAWRAARLAPIEAMRAESGAVVRWGPVSRFLSRFLRGTALRNLWRRPARTLMTAAGLGIGVGFIVALSGITEGARENITRLLSAGQADLVAEQAGASDAAFSEIDERVADLIRVRPEVRAVSKLVFGTTTAPGLPFFLVYGLDPREEYIQHYRIREGRSLQRPREILIGHLAARSLEKQVGDSLHLGGTSYRVVGIYENGMPFEDAGGVIALDEAQRLFHKRRKVSFIGIALHEPQRGAEIAAALEREFPEVIVSRSSEMTERMQDFATMDAVFGAIMVLMVVVGGIVMMNVMMMSVLERTQEIGVLRAVGWSSWRVLRMILVEAFALCVLSAAAGIAIGVGLNALLAFEPTYGQLMTASYTAGTFAWAIGLALALGVLGGLLPAWRAARLRPIEALRYE